MNMDGIELELSLDDLGELKLALGDITLDYENKSKLHAAVESPLILNNSFSTDYTKNEQYYGQDTTVRQETEESQETKDRQDVFVAANTLSSTIMVCSK